MIHSSNNMFTVPASDSTIEWAKNVRAERDTKYGNIFHEESTDLRWVGELGETHD